MSVTVAELAYAVMEGKTKEAMALAKAYYADQSHEPATLPAPNASLMGTVTKGAMPLHPDDDLWDPRVDSGGRHADHPDFGTDHPFDYIGYLLLALAAGTVAALWVSGYNLGPFGVLALLLAGAGMTAFAYTWARR